MVVAIKEGRYLAKEGVYRVEPRQVNDERLEWTNKSPKKPGELVKSRFGEKPVVGSSIQSNSSAPDTPPDSPPKMTDTPPKMTDTPPKMTDTPPKIGQTSQEFSSPKNSSPLFRSTLSPINSNHLFTPPNLTPPVASRPYFKKIVKSGKKLNFKVEQ